MRNGIAPVVRAVFPVLMPMHHGCRQAPRFYVTIPIPLSVTVVPLAVDSGDLEHVYARAFAMTLRKR